MTPALLFAVLASTAAAEPAEAPLAPEILPLSRPVLYPTPVFDLSPDGKTLAGVFSLPRRQHFLRLWDLESGAAVSDLPLGTVEAVTSAKFAPDGKAVAVSLGDRRGTQFVRLVDRSTGATIREFWGFQGSAVVREFSADGKKLVTVDQNVAGRKSFKPQLVTWDVATAKQLSATDAAFDHTLPTATPDGAVRARLGDNREITITRDGAKPFAIPGTKSGNYHSLFLTPDGKRVVAGTHAWAEVYDAATGEKVRVVRADTHVVAAVVPADGGKLLFVGVTAGRPGERGIEPAGSFVCVWDMTKPELKAVIPGLGTDLWKVQPTPDGKRFVAVTGDRWSATKIEVWGTAEKKRLHAFDLPKGQRGLTAVSPDGNWAAHVSWDKEKPTLRVWSTETGKPAEEVAKAAETAAGSLAFTADSKRLVTATDAEYAEWNLATGKKEAGWERDKGDLRARGFEPTVVAIPGHKSVFSVAPTRNRRQSYRLRLSTEKQDWFLGEVLDQASSPVVSADGRWVAFVGGPTDRYQGYLLRLNEDGTPEMRDRKERESGPFVGGSAKQVPAWRAWPINDFPAAISFSADGSRLFTGGLSHALQVWDTETQAPKATLYVAPPAKPGDAPADWAVFTPAGHFAASPGGEKLLRFHAGLRASWYAWPSAETVPAADLPKLRDPAKVKEALGVK
jgi:WD40 repeat protein